MTALGGLRLHFGPPWLPPDRAESVYLLVCVSLLEDMSKLSVHHVQILADAAANLELILGYDAPYYRLPQPPGYDLPSSALV
jgi:hypothetical protein